MFLNEKKYKIVGVVPYIVMLVLMIFVIGSKTNLHGDEVFSYGLANHKEGINIKFEDAVTYTPASQVYFDYLTVGVDGFDYGNVWNNQTLDVHPPLYYVLLHTICSLFPGTFSFWYAGCINIVFMLMTLYYANKIVMMLIKDEKYVNLFSIMFALSAGLLSSVSFFRMYGMAMFLCTVLSYIMLKELLLDRRGQQPDYYVKLLLVSVLGALTHYYCIVFLVFTCLISGVYLIIRKCWKMFALTVFTELCAGALSVLIFPAMLSHMFRGSRGTEVISNLKGTECFLQALFPQKCRLTSSKLHGEFPQYCISSAGTLSGAGKEPLQAYKVY